MGKTHLTSRGLQGIFGIIAGIVLVVLVGRPAWVAKLDTVDIAEVGKSGVNWFTHVDTDINYSLGSAVEVTKKSDGKVVETYDLFVVANFDKKGNVIPEKSFIYLSDDDTSTMVTVTKSTAAYVNSGYSDDMKNPAKYNVKGTLSSLNGEERNRVIKYVRELGFSDGQAEDIVGKYMLVNEKGSDMMIIIYIGFGVMAIGLIVLVVSLIRSKNEIIINQ